MVTILAFVVVLGVLILVHEWGHFVTARLFGVRVDVFSFGFGPRLAGWKRGATDYRVSAFPLGGYVRMAGENPTEERTGAADEFLSKPRWQRAIIAAAGPTMNIILTLVVMIGLSKAGGLQPAFMDSPAHVEGVVAGTPAAEAGIESGDSYVQIRDRRNPTWEDAFFEAKFVMPGDSIPVVVSRGGQLLSMTVHVATADLWQDSPEGLFGYVRYPVLVDTVNPGDPAAKAGLQSGDIVEKENGKPLGSTMETQAAIRSSNGNPIRFLVLRDHHEIEIAVTPAYADLDGSGKRWYVGAFFGPKSDYVSHRWGQAVEEGALYTVGWSGQVIHVIAGLFTGKVSLRQLGGPVAIAQGSGQAAKAGLGTFLSWIALISMNLAILNLLPIPILDGGHLLMLAIEGVLRHDLSLAVKERFVQVGLVFLLALVAFVMYSDIAKIIQHH